MTRLAVRTTLLTLALLVAAVASAQTPPWGDAAYDAEVAIYSGDVLEMVVRTEVGPQGVRYTARDADGEVLMEALLTWSDGTVGAWLHDGEGFEPADELAGTVLSAIVDPTTPAYGVCAAADVRCEVEGEEEVAGRAARRMAIEQPGLGPATVWVDLATGLAIASETGGDPPTRSELVRLDEGAPDPGRLVP
jgi:hypothetical protein